ncbi:MAG: prolipoprotein diacylglyceryl transferase [bacterium]|nr:MAG: prolipoprotein diacylglyceryl transferase [bacterium]
MFPILIELGPVTLYTYGLLAATGLLTGIAYMAHLAKKEGIGSQIVFDLGFILVLSGIVGSRLLYVIVNYHEYLAHPFRVLKIWEGGLVFYGGLVGALAGGYRYVKKQNLKPWQMADLAAPAIALGHTVGRLGCFAAGCCYGKPTDSWIGVTFTNVDTIAPRGIPIYPTQLFESLMEFSFFLILTYMRPYKKFQGQIFLMWLMFYAVGRSIVEFYRGDPRGYIIGDAVSTSQGVAVVVFFISLILYLRFLRSAR